MVKDKEDKEKHVRPLVRTFFLVSDLLRQHKKRCPNHSSSQLPAVT